MKKRICFFIVTVLIVFSCTSLAAPESQQKSWNEICQERVTVYDQDNIIQTDTIEEITEKRETMRGQMESNKATYLARQQQALEDGHEMQPPIMPLIGEDESWNCPYSEILGGYTLIASDQRLSINVDPNTNVDDIVNEVQEKVSSACTYDTRPQGIFRYYDYNSTPPLQTGITQVNEPAWSMVDVSGYSLPNDYFVEREPGVYYTRKSGHTKIIFRYNVCEMFAYWDPNLNESVTDYFYYDLYMPMDVIIGDATRDALFDEWKVDGQVQDWLFTNCKEALSDDALWRTIENYMQVDACDFNFDFLGYGEFALTSNSRYQNSHGGAKKIPPIIKNMNAYNMYLYFSDCNLEGQLPPNMGVGFGGTCTFDFSDNRLCGTIPRTGFGLTIDISNNQFTIIGEEVDSSIVSLDISNNFILKEEIDNYIPAGIPCTGKDQQYQLELVEPGRNIEILPGTLITSDAMKVYTQVTRNGVVQDWTVASELVFEMEPDETLSSLLEGNAQTGYIAQMDGSGSVWLGFTHDKHGTQLYKSETIGIGNVPVIIGEGDAPNKVQKMVSEGEILQITVSGKNLQNILTRTFHVSYQANDLELLDAYSPTAAADLALGPVAGSNMAITEIVPGSLKFQLAPDMGAYSYWGGVAAVLKFRAKRNITTIINLL